MYRLGIIFVVIVIGLGFLFFHGGSNTSSDQKERISTVTYQCDNNHTITATFYEGPEIEQTSEIPVPTGSVELVLDGGESRVFPQTISASGVRYATEDESFVFWTKGEESFVMRGDMIDNTYTNCLSTDSKYLGWTATTTDLVSFRYPDFSHEYISAVTWPPQITPTESEYLCADGEEREINGTQYCITTSSEGAAGSTYVTYTYLRDRFQADVTLRFPQCLNYDEPQQADCLQDQQSLDIDLLIDSIISTAF